jgi:hypothetical protein
VTAYLEGFGIADWRLLRKSDGPPDSLGVFASLRPDLDVDQDHQNPSGSEERRQHVDAVNRGKKLLRVAGVLLRPVVPVDGHRGQGEGEEPTADDEAPNEALGHVPVVVKGVEYGDVAVACDGQKLANGVGASESRHHEPDDAGDFVLTEGLDLEEAQVVGYVESHQEVGYRQAVDELVGGHRRQVAGEAYGEDGQQVAGNDHDEYDGEHYHPGDAPDVFLTCLFRDVHRRSSSGTPGSKLTESGRFRRFIKRNKCVISFSDFH